ncbi:glycosyltransferase family 39 protein [Undibacterium sp. Jales W-56]|uniref:ArnT family glycosyltransferase n=1 Tax=Undibacterium sp. Jales W-56 TaxID=2897325 RepID=UPI0021CEFEDE|nr:glycosyltransferase family 39 protein [Undibacterium sp. Jales W-56]MCU6433230.1 glycosyltransferase family 39 protein [Undibacterium sp. Jales W-56]
MFIPLWMVWVIALIFVGAGLGSYAILDNNEGLYAEISREMLQSGDWRQWIIPHLNGLVYMEKPPLLYWLTALSFAVFGESEWAARLVPALSSLSCVGLILWFGGQLQRTQTARLAALMFVSGLGVTAMSRTLMFDMLLTCLLTASLMWAYFFVTLKERRALCYSYAFLALAVLAKGFVAGVLFCAVTGCFVMTQSSSVRKLLANVSQFFDKKAIGVFLLIALPWHVVASLIEPIFAWFYFINEHVLRFLGKREPHDYYAGAWWYYLPRMVIYLFPWSFLLAGIFFAKRVNQIHKPLQWFLSFAWIMPVLFFSNSSAKANYYLVAVMPLASFQLAILFEDRQYGGRWGRMLPGLLLTVLFCLLTGFVFSHPQEKLQSIRILGLSAQQFVSYGLICLSILAAAASWLAWRTAKIGILGYLLLPIATLFILLNILHVSDESTSTRPIADALMNEHAGKKIMLFQVFEDQSSLTFYLKRPVYIVESRSNDLFWGNKLHNNNIVLSASEFDAMTAAEPLAIVVMNRDIPLFKTKSYANTMKVARRFANASIFVN